MYFCVLALPLVGAFNFFQRSTPSKTALNARTSIIGGNWKMNPSTVDEAQDLAKAVVADAEKIKGEAILFPPAPFMGPVADIVGPSPVHLGAQLVYYEDKGAYTGATAASMVKSFGTTYVLAGHSERRTIFGDDDDAINKQVVKTIEHGMFPVLCIGETKEEYDSGLVESVCAIQLAKDLVGVSKDDMKNIVIAYEPVWAIGTGLVCPTDVAQATHAFIRSKLADMYDSDTADAVRIQYGGSVSPDSVDDLMAQADIDGCTFLLVLFHSFFRPRRRRVPRQRQVQSDPRL